MYIKFKPLTTKRKEKKLINRRIFALHISKNNHGFNTTCFVKYRQHRAGTV